jgi:hypothetical protein
MAVPLPVDMNFRNLECGVPGIPDCGQVMAFGPVFREDPCDGGVDGEVPSCEDLISSLNGFAGAMFRQSPCDLPPLCPGQDGSAVDIAIVLMQGCPIPPAPTCEDFLAYDAQVAWTARFDPCALPEPCQGDDPAVLMATPLIVTLLSCLNPPCDGCSPPPGLCDLLNNGIYLTGGNGGDAGPLNLNLNLAASSTWAVAPGQLTWATAAWADSQPSSVAEPLSGVRLAAPVGQASSASTASPRTRPGSLIRRARTGCWPMPTCSPEDLAAQAATRPT